MPRCRDFRADERSNVGTRVRLLELPSSDLGASVGGAAAPPCHGEHLLSKAAVRLSIIGLSLGLAGTIPQLCAQAPQLSLSSDGGKVLLRYQLESKEGVATIYSSDDLAVAPDEWPPFRIFPGSSGITGQISLPNYENSSCRFFRIETQPLAVPKQMVWIRPGNFLMGSPETEPGRYPDEGPPRPVSIAEGFWLSKYEVTQAQYEELTGENPSQGRGDPNRPVEMVSWNDAVRYCAMLTEREYLAGRLPPGYVYRLPTEAEWEYACRAGSTTAYGFGDDRSRLNQYAWWGDNGGAYPHPVGSAGPNAWGLYDMHGNVFEWCLDKYEAYPGGQIQGTSERRVVRSGAFYCPWNILRSACRFESTRPTSISSLVGFRVALGPIQALTEAQLKPPPEADSP